MKKQTAVEWYENEIIALIRKYENQEISKWEYIIMRHNLFYPAKAMERNQIIDAYNAARNDHHQMYIAEEYYNETYGGDK
jgi:hypothetical protein